MKWGLTMGTPKANEKAADAHGKIYLTPKRYQFKRNRLDYQPLFRKGACTGGLHSQDWCKSSLTLEMRAFLVVISLSAPKKNNTLTSKDNWNFLMYTLREITTLICTPM